MKIILKILPVIFILTFFSCGNKSSRENLPDLSNVDKITLIYKADFDSKGIMNLKSVDITDPKIINTIESLTTAKPTTYLYCISTGAMNFYNKNEILVSIVFNTSSDFRHIAYNYNNKLIALDLSEENAALLESFKNQFAKK